MAGTDGRSCGPVPRPCPRERAALPAGHRVLHFSAECVRWPRSTTSPGGAGTVSLACRRSIPGNDTPGSLTRQLSAVRDDLPLYARHHIRPFGVNPASAADPCRPPRLNSHSCRTGGWSWPARTARSGPRAVGGADSAGRCLSCTVRPVPRAPGIVLEALR